MTGRLPITKTGMLKFGIFAGALFLVAAVLYDGFSWDSKAPEAADDRSFDITGTECHDIDLGQYSDLIAPIYLQWGEPTELSGSRSHRNSWVTCASQSAVAEGLCEDAANMDCIDDWYSESPSIINQFRVTISYRESPSKAADSLDGGNEYDQAVSSGRWDEVYESRKPLSWGQQVELTSILRVENMTIEMHSIIGRRLQTEATMDQIVAIHYAIADELAQAAEI